MKSLKLKALGLEEMKSEEVFCTDGGVLPALVVLVLGACASGFIWDVLGNPKATKEAWDEGRKEVFGE